MLILVISRCILYGITVILKKLSILENPDWLTKRRNDFRIFGKVTSGDFRMLAVDSFEYRFGNGHRFGDRLAWTAGDNKLKCGCNQ